MTLLQPSTIPAPSSTRPAAAVDRAFTPARSLAEAETFVRRLAYGHYENFSVVSVLVPKRLRADFCALYAFCRLADDLGDEVGDPQASIEALDRFREHLQASYHSEPTTACFLALRETIRRHDIPAQPFLDLIAAFQQDQRQTRYANWADVIDYCTRSADPVGRLVLYVCGYRDAERQRLSDKTCTALQLANFWQDVRRDLEGLDRIYIPADLMAARGVSEADLRAASANEKVRALTRELVDRTQALFDEGKALLPLLSKPVAAHVGLFGKGGEAILEAIRRQDFDTLSHRPTLSKRAKGRLVARAAVARLMTIFSAGRAS
ncbi:MAG: squalene synthase HpnC [Tepidisphaeraceae bacterium]